VRFFLDNDIDAAVGVMLRREKHKAWAASQAGLADASDDEISVYAVEHHAAVVTHDQAFTERRRKNTYGQHVWVRSAEWEAAAVLQAVLAELCVVLASMDAVVVRVTATGIQTWAGRWQ
jgi:predicted nuclease of predicted toxin-antitoxin system